MCLHTCTHMQAHTHGHTTHTTHAECREIVDERLRMAVTEGARGYGLDQRSGEEVGDESTRWGTPRVDGHNSQQLAVNTEVEICEGMEDSDLQKIKGPRLGQTEISAKPAAQSVHEGGRQRAGFLPSITLNARTTGNEAVSAAPLKGPLPPQQQQQQQQLLHHHVSSLQEQHSLMLLETQEGESWAVLQQGEDLDGEGRDQGGLESRGQRGFEQAARTSSGHKSQLPGGVGDNAGEAGKQNDDDVHAFAEDDGKVDDLIAELEFAS